MTDANRYTILLEHGGGWGAWSPDLPGCVALGDTIDEAVAEMHEAIAFHLEGMAESGEPIPEPSGPASTSSTRRVPWRRTGAPALEGSPAPTAGHLTRAADAGNRARTSNSESDPLDVPARTRARVSRRLRLLLDGRWLPLPPVVSSPPPLESPHSGSLGLAPGAVHNSAARRRRVDRSRRDAIRRARHHRCCAPYQHFLRNHEMYYADHPPPHFHTRYSGETAKIDIATGEVIAGRLTSRALRLVRE